MDRNKRRSVVIAAPTSTVDPAFSTNYGSAPSASSSSSGAVNVISEKDKSGSSVKEGGTPTTDPTTQRRKRSSLQASTHVSIVKNAQYSIPPWLELASRNGVVSEEEMNKGKENVLIFGERGGRKSLRAGSLISLVDFLLHEEKEVDYDYVEAFLATHSYFLDTQTLLTRMMERFYLGDKTERVLSIFRKWMDEYPEDFQQEQLVLFQMFISDLSSSSFASYSVSLTLEEPAKKQIKELVDEASTKLKKGNWQVKLKEKWWQLRLLDSAPPASLNSPPPILEFKKLDPKRVAIELSMIEFNYYTRPSMREYLHQAWSKQQAPHLQELISRCNAVSYWIATNVMLSSKSAKKRSKALRFFIQLGQQFLRLKNYQGAMEVFSSLSLKCISKLKSEWKHLSDEDNQGFLELKETFVPSGNFKAYRVAVKSSQAPFLPLLSLVLSDLTMIEENKTTLNDGSVALVHFEKMQMIWETLSLVQRGLSKKYEREGGGSQIDESFLNGMLYTLPRLGEQDLNDLADPAKAAHAQLSHSGSGCATSSSEISSSKSSDPHHGNGNDESSQSSSNKMSPSRSVSESNLSGIAKNRSNTFHSVSAATSKTLISNVSSGGSSGSLNVTSTPSTTSTSSSTNSSNSSYSSAPLVTVSPAASVPLPSNTPSTPTLGGSPDSQKNKAKSKRLSLKFW